MPEELKNCTFPVPKTPEIGLNAVA